MLDLLIMGFKLGEEEVKAWDEERVTGNWRWRRFSFNPESGPVR